MRGIVIARAHVALVLFAALSAVAPISAAAADAPVNILFVGNSFTHGRYEPVRTYNAGFSAGDVHDLLCPSLATCSSAEQGTQIDPAETPPGDLPLIAGTAWDMVVLQDQSFRPLPATITVNGQSVATRGDFAGFVEGG